MTRSCNPVSYRSHTLFPAKASSHGDKPYAWPVEPQYLSALSALGMSNAQIAEYFRVKPLEVEQVRTKVLDI